MWTHADTMWTDADCPQKCRQMWQYMQTVLRPAPCKGKRYGTVWYTSDLASEHDILR